MRSKLPERNLDVLRAIAVLLVVCGHLTRMWDVDRVGPITPWELGRLGVLIFFVHTSLVLMASLERLEETGSRPLRLSLAFYLRRAFRIYPLAIACTLGYVLFHVPGDSPPRPGVPFSAPTRWELLTNLALVQNLAATRYVIDVLWSLPIEVQMYVVLPICYFAAKGGMHYLILLFLVAIFAWGTVIPYVPGGWRLTVLHFGPCFLAGVTSYALLRRHMRPRLPGWTWPLALMACVPALVLARRETYAIVRGWAFCLALGLCIPLVKELTPSLLTRAAAIIARYSYGIYLTHVAALYVAFVLLSGTSMVARWIVFGVLVTALPVLAYHTIEAPMIALGIVASERVQKGSRSTDAAAVAPAP